MAIIIQTLVAYLNVYRSIYCLSNVFYGYTIAESAQKWADTVAKTDKFIHSDTYYGENMAMIYAINKTDNDVIKEAIDKWMEERSKYDYNNHEYTPEAGHFTQCVWRSTRRIGVGIATSSGKPGYKYVVMQFDPAGNVFGSFRNNVGKACKC